MRQASHLPSLTLKLRIVQDEHGTAPSTQLLIAMALLLHLGDQALGKSLSVVVAHTAGADAFLPSSNTLE